MKTVSNRIQSLADALYEEVNETSDISPTVTVSRRNLRALLDELVSKEITCDDE